MKMNSGSRLILASKSPRRSQLLRDCGFEFETFALDIEESYPEDLLVTEIAEYLSEKKNASYREQLKTEVILTADTTVAHQGRLLEKPQDQEDAERMIRELSGRTHQVISGVTISDPDQSISFSEITSVTFKELSKPEVDYYVREFRPFDKAGAYGIQEWIGLVGVIDLKGSYFNVMGLPTDKVYQVLTGDFNLWPRGMQP